MRYYGEDYSQELKRSISAVRDVVETRNYAVPINTAPVTSDRYGIRNQGISASRQAYSHISDIKYKFDRLQEVLDTFYADVDETGANIIEMADIIEGLIQESNNTLSRLSRMLRGVGEYTGKTITPESIRSVGIKVNNKSRYEDFWIMVLDTDLMAGNAREELVDIYLERLESKQDITLTSKDTKMMQGLLDHYSRARFGETDDIRDLDDVLIDHCVKIYEYMYPEDVKILNKFFEDPLNENNSTMELNIRNIKYGLYTADPMIREIILHYLPKMALNDYKGNEFTKTQSKEDKITIDINLKASYSSKYNSNKVEVDPFAGFFHEVAHGIDELSATESTYRTSGIEPTIYRDVYNRFTDVLKESKISLDSTQEEKILDFLFGVDNINVVKPNDKDIGKYLPSKWDDDMKSAYKYLREYYGYVDLIFDKHRGYTLDEHISESGEIGYDGEYELTSDIVGAVTNNKVAGYPYAHGATFLRGGSFVSASQDGLKEQLVNESYWFNREDHSSTHNVEREFFAHYFNERAVGFDSEPSRKNFPKSCAEADRIIESIYKDLESK
ncbi:MAG: hypothetical protein J6U54_22845 [Clostridiales bacterium]|nr:hypothetical protein [Clostridiales bacterium]